MVKKPAPLHQKPRNKWAIIGLWAGLAVLAFVIWFWRPITSYASTGAAIGAHVACSCRYIGGRELGDCRKDFEPGMGLVVLSEDAEEKSITARFPFLATHTARFRAGAGCVMDAWQD